MNQELIDMAKQAGWQYAHGDSGYEPLWKFAALVAAAERERITKMLNYLDMKAQPYHNYYKHAAIEINRPDGEGELI
jgi:hypothetical protein